MAGLARLLKVPGRLAYKYGGSMKEEEFLKREDSVTRSEVSAP